MLRTSVCCAMLTICCLITSVANAGDRSRPAVTWQNNLREAHTAALEDGKPLLLVFGAEWCGWCKRLESTTLAQPELAKYINEHFVPVHIDVDDEQGHRVSEILEVSSLPCTVIVTSKAELIDKFVGYKEVPDYYQKLSAAVQRHATLTQTQGISTPQ